jgi:hypothetical protein
LPTWSPQQVDALMQRYRISPSRRQWLEGYFSLYTPKIMVQAPNGTLNYGADTRAIEPAQKAALDGCEKAAKIACAPIMKNFEMVTAGN